MTMIESMMISWWKQRNNTTKPARQCSSFMSQVSVKIISHTITKLTLKHWMNAENIVPNGRLLKDDSKGYELVLVPEDYV